jgi:hypothetical protein
MSKQFDGPWQKVVWIARDEPQSTCNLQPEMSRQFIVPRFAKAFEQVVGRFLGLLPDCPDYSISTMVRMVGISGGYDLGSGLAGALLPIPPSA